MMATQTNSTNDLNILSWNVNGLRAVMKKGFVEFLEKHGPDIMCLQETKLQEHQAPKLEIPYPYQYYHSAEKKGYSGTAIFSHVKPLSVSYGLTEGGYHPQEGRILNAEFEQFYLVNVYVPNSQDQLRRLDYRTNEFDPAFREYLVDLSKQKPVIVCGDLNVAHREIDLARPKPNQRSAGFTDEERRQLSNLLEAGFIDTFRHLHPEETEQYSWWSYRAGARQRNIGWRIDYFLISTEIQSNLKHASILPDVLGSDHCPVGIKLAF